MMWVYDIEGKGDCVEAVFSSHGINDEYLLTAPLLFLIYVNEAYVS